MKLVNQFLSFTLDSHFKSLETISQNNSTNSQDNKTRKANFTVISDFNIQTADEREETIRHSRNLLLDIDKFPGIEQAQYYRSSSNVAWVNTDSTVLKTEKEENSNVLTFQKKERHSLRVNQIYGTIEGEIFLRESKLYVPEEDKLPVHLNDSFVNRTTYKGFIWLERTKVNTKARINPIPYHQGTGGWVISWLGTHGISQIPVYIFDFYNGDGEHFKTGVFPWAGFSVIELFSLAQGRAVFARLAMTSDQGVHSFTTDIMIYQDPIEAIFNM